MEKDTIPNQEITPGDQYVEGEDIVTDWASALQELEDVNPDVGKSKKRGVINKVFNALRKSGLVKTSRLEEEIQTEQIVRQELIERGISSDDVDELILKIGKNIWSADEFNAGAWEFFKKAKELLETSALPKKEIKITEDADIERAVEDAINKVAQAIFDIEAKNNPTREELEKVRDEFTGLVEWLADKRVLSVWQPSPGERSQDIRKTIQDAGGQFSQWLKEEKNIQDGLENQNVKRDTFILYDRAGQRVFINPLVAQKELGYKEEVAALPQEEFDGIIGDLKRMAASIAKTYRRLVNEQGGRAYAVPREGENSLMENSQRSAGDIELLLKETREKFSQNTLTQDALFSAQREISEFISSALWNKVLRQYPLDATIEKARTELEQKGLTKENAAKLLVERRIGNKHTMFAPAYLYEATSLDNQTKAAVDSFIGTITSAQEELAQLSRELKGTAKVEATQVVLEGEEDLKVRIKKLEEEDAVLKKELELKKATREIQITRAIAFGRSEEQKNTEKYRVLSEQQALQINELTQKVKGMQEQITRLTAENEALRNAQAAVEEGKLERLLASGKTFTPEQLRSVYEKELARAQREGKNLQEAQAFAILVLQEILKRDR